SGERPRQKRHVRRHGHAAGDLRSGEPGPRQSRPAAHVPVPGEIQLIRVPTAIDVSSVVGLVAVGIFTAQILLGLLLSVGYNPLRQFPRQPLKLFTFHNWLGYIGLATAALHPTILLFSSTAGFRIGDIL